MLLYFCSCLLNEYPAASELTLKSKAKKDYALWNVQEKMDTKIREFKNF